MKEIRIPPKIKLEARDLVYWAGTGLVVLGTWKIFGTWAAVLALGICLIQAVLKL